MTITLKYVTATSTTRDITVKDYRFVWEEVLWEEGVSITGKKRNVHRGYKPLLELTFENDVQLRTVAKEIYDTLLTGTVQYSSDGEIPMVISEFRSSGDYRNQIQFKPSSMLLEGNIQSSREFVITGILSGATDVFCGQTDILCGA